MTNYVEFILPSTKAVKVRAKIDYIFSEFFGCHARGVANLRLTVSATADPKKELNQSYGSGFMNGNQQKEATQFIRENCLPQLYTPLKQECLGYSVVFMSGACNTDEGAPENVIYSGAVSTAGFAAWLKDQGEFIMATPLLSNAHHLQIGFSVLRGWMWVPSHSNPDSRHIEGTEYVSGESKSFLPFPEWWAFYENFRKNKRLKPLKEFKPEDLIAS